MQVYTGSVDHGGSYHVYGPYRSMPVAPGSAVHFLREWNNNLHRAHWGSCVSRSTVRDFTVFGAVYQDGLDVFAPRDRYILRTAFLVLARSVDVCVERRFSLRYANLTDGVDGLMHPWRHRVDVLVLANIPTWDYSHTEALRRGVIDATSLHDASGLRQSPYAEDPNAWGRMVKQLKPKWILVFGDRNAIRADDFVGGDDNNCGDYRCLGEFSIPMPESLHRDGVSPREVGLWRRGLTTDKVGVVMRVERPFPT